VCFRGEIINETDVIIYGANRCADCSEEFEALLAAFRAISQYSQNPSVARN